MVVGLIYNFTTSVKGRQLQHSKSCRRIKKVSLMFTADRRTSPVVDRSIFERASVQKEFRADSPNLEVEKFGLTPRGEFDSSNNLKPVRSHVCF